MRIMGHVTMERRPDVTDATLMVAFSGWSDAGGAASTAVQYVSERTEARRFASIDGEEFFDFTVQRPLVRLDQQRLRTFEWPGYEILSADSRNLLFLVGPEPHLRWKTFCRAIVQLAREIGVARVALLGAFLAEVVHSDPVPLTGFASDPEFLERLKVSATGYEGPTGIVGALANSFQQEAIPLVSLWAAIPHYIATSPNPCGALALLLKLREWMTLPIDFGPLESAATTFQAKLLEAVESNETLSSYVRALKKPETSH
jgi:predicted ATP-grasp superfamily ATP-dependent carboligase